jgi:FkbM family methyltransferase
MKINSYLPPSQIMDHGHRWLNLKYAIRHARIEKRSIIKYFLSILGVLFGYISSYLLSYNRDFERRFLKKGSDGKRYYYFNGIKLPYIDNEEKIRSIRYNFADIFLFYCYYNDNYNKTIVELLDPYMPEGPYGYIDGNFDVTIKQNDIVMDIGAWIGDFSAYACAKGSTVYAFEPVEETYKILMETSVLNNTPGKIFPIKKGLGNIECNIPIYLDSLNSGGSSIISKKNMVTETIAITTLDRFIDENNIKKVDFIKADIEGAERDMLKGAEKTLKIYEPKLAICTYHYHDDPEILEKIILDINPKYKIRHIRKKLFAVVEK